MSPDVRRVLDAVMDHENIPRKKPKFANFVKNVVRGVRPATIDDTWELFEQALKKPKEDVKETKAEEPAEVESGEAADGDEGKGEEEEERLGVTRFKGAKLDESISNGDGEEKKEKKKKKKDKKKDLGESDMGKENGVQSGKKRKRKDLEESSETVDDNDEPPASKKKKKKAKSEVDEDQVETKKFVWDDVIESVLKEEGDGVKVKRLKKKVLAEYVARFGDTHRTREELSAKLDKKINKSQRFKVLKEVVTLKND